MNLQVIHGKVVKSPAKGQLIELQATDLKVIGECDPGKDWILRVLRC